MVTWALRWECQLPDTMVSKNIGQRLPLLVIPHLVRQCPEIGFGIFLGRFLSYRQVLMRETLQMMILFGLVGLNWINVFENQLLLQFQLVSQL
jgi:hypothetical protein